MMMDGTNECGICFGERTKPVKLPCGHSFCADCLSGWKSKYAFDRPDGERSAGDRTSGAKERQRKRCPLCRGIIPPSQEQIAGVKFNRALMKDTSDPNYVRSARLVKQFEDEYGEDWEGTMIDYDNDYVSLPLYVGGALTHGNLRTVLQWIGKGKIKERVNAKCEDGGNAGLLFLAAGSHQHDLMSYLLLNGADINILDSAGISMLTKSCTSLFIDKVDYSGENRMLLSWGAELFLDGKHITSQEMKLSLCDALVKNGYIAIANLMSSELGGRRCEIVSAPNTRGDLVGKTCVVEEYINESDQYKVTMEFTNESLLIGSDNLKRRDRTPQDPGYYVECKNNKLIRRDFKSNEECQAFIACLDADDEEIAAVDPEAEAKADQAAADLLAELGMDDLEDPSSNSLNKGKQSVPAGKKKKRGGGKKKGRK